MEERFLGRAGCSCHLAQGLGVTVTDLAGNPVVCEGAYFEAVSYVRSFTKK